MVWRVFVLAILLSTISAGAVELRPVKVTRGTHGLTHVPVDVTNAGTEALTCTIQLAHWYSAAIVDTAPGASAHIDLWFAPASGTYLILNDKQDNMPVESLWCGIAGRAYETRAAIALDRQSRTAPAARKISCSVSGSHLSCK